MGYKDQEKGCQKKCPHQSVHQGDPLAACLISEHSKLNVSLLILSVIGILNPAVLTYSSPTPCLSVPWHPSPCFLNFFFSTPMWPCCGIGTSSARLHPGTQQWVTSLHEHSWWLFQQLSPYGGWCYFRIAVIFASHLASKYQMPTRVWGWAPGEPMQSHDILQAPISIDQEPNNLWLIQSYMYKTYLCVGWSAPTCILEHR